MGGGGAELFTYPYPLKVTKEWLPSLGPALGGSSTGVVGGRDERPIGGGRGAAMSGARERNVLFNDALNTFYLRLYGVRHMVKDHSDSEKGNPLPPPRLLLSINSKGSFICIIPQTG